MFLCTCNGILLAQHGLTHSVPPRRSSDLSSRKVATRAHGLAADLLKAYPVPLAPAKAPDPAMGTRLYVQSCSACHGLTGDGHGPGAARLDPPPIAFTDAERARQRSVFALYPVIRSETRRVGKGCVSTFSTWWSPEH